MPNALLIVDMQNAWIDSEKEIFPDVEIVISNIQLLKNHFKANGEPVFYLTIEHEADGSDSRVGEKTFCIKGSKSAQIIDDLKPEEGDIVITKIRLSGFFKTNLFSELQARGVTGVAVTGLELRACVLATYIDAYQNDFRPVAIISDAILDRNKKYLTDFLETFKTENFLISTEQWIQMSKLDELINK